MRSQHVQILRLESHALTDHTLQTGETDAELVLQQLAHGTNAAVAQVVDIIQIAKTDRKAIHVVDRGENIVNDNVLGNKLVHTGNNGFLQLAVAGAGFQNLRKNAETHTLVHAALLVRVKGQEVVDFHHAVGNHFYLTLTHRDKRNGNTRVVNGFGFRVGYHLPRLRHQLAGQRVDNRLGKTLAYDTARQIQLFVVLVTSHTGKIIPAGVKEQTIDVRLRALDGRRLTRTQLAVHLKKGFLCRLAGILFDGGANTIVLSEILIDLGVRAKSQGTDKHRYRDFTVFVNTNIENIVRIVFIFKPGTAVRNHGGAEQLLACLVVIHFIVHAGGTNELGNNDALRAVNHKGTAFRHEREIAHEHFGLLDLTAFLIEQSGCHAKGGGIGGVAFLAFLYTVVRFVDVKLIVDKVEHEIACVVCDTGDILEDFLKALVKKPGIGILLHLDQIRHSQDFVNSGKAHAGVLADLHRFDIHHWLNHSIHIFTAAA